MAKLKKLYYSLTQNQFLDVINLNNTQDIGNVYSNESLKVIKYSAPVDSLNLLNLVKDLLYNDIQLNLEITQISKVLSNGVFKNVGSEFFLEETKNLPFLTKLRLKPGQIKINESVVFRDDSLSQLGLNGNLTLNSNVITGITSTSSLSVGMSINNLTYFPLSTTIRKILSINSIEVSEVSNATISNQPLNIKNDFSYEILNLNFNGDISNGSDVISNIHSVNEIYLGMRVTNVNFPIGTIVLEKLSSSSIRVSNNSNASIIQTSINFTNEIETDGFYRRDSIQINDDNEIVFKIGEESFFASSDLSQQDRINDSHYVLYSILVRRVGLNTFIENVTQLWKFTGLISSILPITKAELDKDFLGYYSLETGDRIHLVNSNGQLLDWQSGQSSDADISSIGASYSEDSNASEYLKTFDKTQLPQSFDEINSSSLVNIPFRITNVQNIFGNSDIVPIKKAILATKSDSLDYGDEGIEVKISTANSIFEASEFIDGFSYGTTNSTITLNSFNFTLPINSFTLELNDFILVTDGDGRFQIGKINIITSNVLYVSGLTKPLSPSGIGRSKIQIFKNSSIVVINDSNIFIDNNNLVSQVLSGGEGKFGVGDEWVKIALTYTIEPQVIQNKWYFLQVKGYNINPPTWGNLPYITIENPYTQINDNKTKSAFYQINYSLISGIYPNGDILIEDELGDIGVENPDRLSEPFFRPIKYNLLSNDLSDFFNVNDLQENLKENDVFVDVKNGRILFKNGYEPRRVYVSYKKINILNGDSSSNNLRYNLLNNGYSTNIQNKLIELDLRFDKGTEFKSNITIDGINSSNSEDLYRGAVSVEDNKIFLNDFFDFHNKTSELNLLKINKSFIDEIISINKKDLVLKRKVFENELSHLSVLENSNLTELYRPGLITNDIQIYPKNKNLKEPFSFYRKKFNDKISLTKEFNDSVPELEYNGEFNNLNFNLFKDEIVIDSILTKDLSFIPFLGEEYPIDSKHFKIGNIISYKNRNEIKSEKYFTKVNSDFDNFELNKICSISPFIESRNLSEIEIFKNINSHIIENINPIDYSIDVLEDKILFSFINNSDNNVIRIYKINRSVLSENEIDNIVVDSIDYINSNSLQKIKVVTKFISENTFASIWTCLNAGNFELYVSIYSINNSGNIEVIKENVLLSDEVYLHNYFDFIVQQNKLVVIWKQTLTKTSFVFYDFKKFERSPINVFSNLNVYRDLKIFNYSEFIFGIIIPSLGSLQIRLFNNFSEVEYFNVNNIFLNISTSNITDTFDTSLVKLNSNNFAFSYSELISGTITTKISLITDLHFLPDNQIIKTIELESGISPANRITDVNLKSVSEDLIVVSYEKDGVYNYRLFTNNLEELPFNYIDSNVNPLNQRSSSKLINCSFNSFINVFKETNSSIKLDSFEIRPDFSRIIRDVSDSDIDLTLSNITYTRTIKSQNYLIQAFNENNSNIKITIFDINDIYDPIKINSIPFNIASGLLDSEFDVEYLRNESGYEILVFSFSDSDDVKIQFVNIDLGIPVLIGTPINISLNVPDSKSRIVKFDINDIFICFKNASNNLLAIPVKTNIITLPVVSTSITLINETTDDFEFIKLNSSNLYSFYYKNTTNLKQIAIDFTSPTSISIGNKILIDSDLTLFNRDNLINSGTKTIVSYINSLGENVVSLIDFSQLLLSISNSIVILDTKFFSSFVLETYCLNVTDSDKYIGIIFQIGTTFYLRVVLIEENLMTIKYSNIVLKTNTDILNVFKVNSNLHSLHYFNLLDEIKFDLKNFFNLNLNNNLSFTSNSIKCNVINHEFKILKTLEILREDFSQNNSFDYSVSIIKINYNSFGVVYHDSRNKIFLRKYRVDGNEISSISKEIELANGFDLFKNIHLHSFNLKENDKFLIVYENPISDLSNYDFIKKEIYNVNGGLETSEDLEISIPILNISSITWISGNTFEIILSETSDISGFENGLFFDIENDSDLVSFNSTGKLYSISSLDKNLRRFEFSHPTFNSASFNKTNIGRIKFYDYDFRINYIKKYESNYIGIYFNEFRFSNNFVNILNSNAQLNHLGRAFKLLEVDFKKMSKANMDSSGLIFFTYFNELNQLKFLQFGADGEKLNSVQIIGKNSLNNLEVSKIPETQTDIINMRYLNDEFGESSLIELKPTEIIMINDITCLILIEDVLNIRDKIQLYFIRNSNEFDEIKDKLETIFSLEDEINKIYIYISNNRVFIKNNFSESKTLKLVRKNQ